MRVPHKRISESDDRMANTVRQTVSSGVFAEKTIRTAYGEFASRQLICKLIQSIIGTSAHTRALRL